MIAAVLLAGGASRRMGRPKALLPIGGTTFLSRLIHLYAERCSPVIVVLGHQAAELAQAFAAERGRAVFVVNPDPERGQLSSLQTGLAETTTDVVFQPIDYPAVAASTVDALLRAAAPLAIPVHAGKRGHPIRIHQSIARELLALPATGQARDVIRAHYAEAAFVPVQDPGTVTDVDTPEDYEQLRSAAWIS